jgi:deoxyadenosine/deoxycytidine kinase
MPVVIIEGIIGSGKSTLMGAIKGFFTNNPHFFNGSQIHKVVCLTEPLNAFTEFMHYNPLQLFYESPKEYAFPFQCYVIDSFTQFLKKTYNHESNGETLYIYERSLLSCKVFMNAMAENKLLTPFGLDFLKSIITRNVSDLLFKPDAIFFLDIDVNVALDRIYNRGREGESHCDPEQLKRLQRHYNFFLIREKKKNISIQQCDATLGVDDILHKFLNTLSSY